MVNKFLATDLNPLMGQDNKKYDELLYRENLREENERLTTQINIPEDVKEKVRQQDVGYNVANYFVDDVEQNFNQFFRFSFDLIEKGMEVASGDISSLTNFVADKMGLDQLKPEVAKQGNEAFAKMQGLETSLNDPQGEFEAMPSDRLTNWIRGFKDFKASQEEKLVENYKASQLRQNVYAEDKGVVAKTSLLGLSMINNATLDPNNIFFGGFGAKALIRMPMAEYIYNMSDVYDRNIVDYETEDYVNMAKIYGLGKAMGFAARVPGLAQAKYYDWKSQKDVTFLGKSRKFDFEDWGSYFVEDKTGTFQEEPKDFKYTRNGKVLNNSILPKDVYDTGVSPRNYLDTVDDVELKNEILGDMVKLLPYNEDSTKIKDKYTFEENDFNKTLSPENKQKFMEYILTSKTLEGFNPIQKQKDLFDKGNVEKRLDLALDNGIIESDLNLQNELNYRTTNRIPYAPINNQKTNDDYLEVVDNLLYLKLKESGISDNSNVLDWTTYKDAVNEFNKAFKGKNPSILKVKELIDSGELNEFEYNDKWNLENPLGEIEELYFGYKNALDTFSSEDIEKGFLDFKQFVESSEIQGKKNKQVINAIKKGQLNKYNFASYINKAGENFLQFQEAGKITIFPKTEKSIDKYFEDVDPEVSKEILDSLGMENYDDFKKLLLFEQATVGSVSFGYDEIVKDKDTGTYLSIYKDRIIDRMHKLQYMTGNEKDLKNSHAVKKLYGYLTSKEKEEYNGDSIEVLKGYFKDKIKRTIEDGAALYKIHETLIDRNYGIQTYINRGQLIKIKQLQELDNVTNEYKKEKLNEIRETLLEINNKYYDGDSIKEDYIKIIGTRPLEYGEILKISTLFNYQDAIIFSEAKRLLDMYREKEINLDEYSEKLVDFATKIYVESKPFYTTKGFDEFLEKINSKEFEIKELPSKEIYLRTSLSENELHKIVKEEDFTKEIEYINDFMMAKKEVSEQKIFERKVTSMNALETNKVSNEFWNNDKSGYLLKPKDLSSPLVAGLIQEKETGRWIPIVEGNATENYYIETLMKIESFENKKDAYEYLLKNDPLAAIHSSGDAQEISGRFPVVSTWDFKKVGTNAILPKFLAELDESLGLFAKGSDAVTMVEFAEKLFGKDSEEMVKINMHLKTVDYSHRLSNAIKFYQASGVFGDFNKAIGNATDLEKINPLYKEVFLEYKNYFNDPKNITEDEITVYRGERIDGSSRDTFFADIHNSVKVGDIIENARFTSVSETPYIPLNFARIGGHKDSPNTTRIMLAIRVPKGSKYMPFGAHHNFAAENEGFLDMGSKFVVNNILVTDYYGNPVKIYETTLLDGERAVAKDEIYEHGYYLRDGSDGKLKLKTRILGKELGLQFDYLKVQKEREQLLGDIQKVFDAADGFYKINNIERSLEMHPDNINEFLLRGYDGLEKFVSSYNEIDAMLTKDYNDKKSRDIKYPGTFNSYIEKSQDKNLQPHKGKYAFLEAYNYVMSDGSMSQIVNKMIKDNGLSIIEANMDVEDVGGFYDTTNNTVVLNGVVKNVVDTMPAFEMLKPHYTYINSQTYSGIITHELGHAFEKNVLGELFFDSVDGRNFLSQFGHYEVKDFLADEKYKRFFSEYPTTIKNSTVAKKEAFAELFEKAFNPLTVINDDPNKNVLNEFRNLMLNKLGLETNKVNADIDLVNDTISTYYINTKVEVKENVPVDSVAIDEALEGYKFNDGEQITNAVIVERFFNDEDNIEEEAKSKPIEEAIFIYNDNGTILKYDGGFYQGTRGIDHRSFHSMLDDNMKLHKLYDIIPMAIHEPETKTIIVSKKQLPHLAETLFKYFPPNEYDYEELSNWRVPYDPVEYMGEYQKQNRGIFEVDETPLLYSKVPTGEEKGDVSLTLKAAIENINNVFELEQKSKLRTQRVIQTEDGEYKLTYQADEFSNKMLNTAKEDTVISILTPMKHELLKNSKQNIHTIKTMLWNDSRHRTVLRNIDLIKEEFRTEDLIYSIKNSTNLKPLKPNSRLSADFSKNLRTLFEEFVVYKSKDYDTEIQDEVMAIDTFYNKNIVQALVRERNEDFLNNTLKPALKPEFSMLVDNPKLAQMKEVRDILKLNYPEISGDIDFIDAVYILMSKTNRDNNATPINHSVIADVYFRDRESYERIYSGYEKRIEDWLPKIIDGATKNMSNYKIIDAFKKVTSEKWTNSKETIQIKSKSNSIQSLVDNELEHMKREVDQYIGQNIRPQSFYSKEKEAYLTELESKDENGLVQKWLSSLEVNMIKNGMDGVFSPFIKNILGYKYLTSLNFMNEGMINRRAVYSGLERYGLVTPSQYMVNSIMSAKEYYTMTKEMATLIRHYKEIKNFDLDDIKDPRKKLLITTWLNNEIANDMDLDGAGKLYKVSAFLSQGAKGQAYSDVHRKTLAYWDLYNIFSNGLEVPRMNDRFMGTLKNQGLDENDLVNMQTYLKEMNKNRLYDVLFNSAIPKNNMEEHINILFRTIVEQSGEHFDPLSRETQRIGQFGSQPIIKHLLMYKRYTMAQLSNLIRMASTKMRNDGTVEDGQLFKTPTTEDIIRGGYRIAGDNAYFFTRGLGILGTSIITGYLLGDEQKKIRAKAILDDLFEGVLNGNTDSLRTTMDMTIAATLDNYGISNSISGSIPITDLITKPFKRVQMGLKQDVGTQDLMYGVTMATVLPEAMARGYDNITLDKDFAPSLPFSSSRSANRKYKRYLRDAKRIQRRESTPQGIIQQAVISPFLLIRVPEYIKNTLKEDTKLSSELTGIYDNSIPKEAKDELAFSSVDAMLKAKRTEAVLSLTDEELDKQGIGYNKELNTLSPALKDKFTKYIKYKGLEMKEAHLLLLHLNDLGGDEVEKVKFMKDTLPEIDKGIID